MPCARNVVGTGVVLLLLLLLLLLGYVLRVDDRVPRFLPTTEPFACPLAVRRELSNRFTDYDPLNEWSNDYFQTEVVDAVVTTLDPRVDPNVLPDALRPCRAPALVADDTATANRRYRSETAERAALADALVDDTGVARTWTAAQDRFDPHQMNVRTDVDVTAEPTLRYATVAAQTSTPAVRLDPEQTMPAPLEAVRARVESLVRDVAKRLDKYAAVPAFERTRSCVVRVCRPWKAESLATATDAGASAGQTTDDRIRAARATRDAKQRTTYYVWRDTYRRARRSHGFQVEWTAKVAPGEPPSVWYGEVVGNDAGDTRFPGARSRATDTDVSDGGAYPAAYAPSANAYVANPDTLRTDLLRRFARNEASVRDKAYRCVDQPKYLLDEERCVAPLDEYGRRKPVGIWDAPCTVDTDCPFYQANRNYENARGGCRTDGTCEMPVNVTRVGFRQHNGKPHCHNCRLDRALDPTRGDHGDSDGDGEQSTPEAEEAGTAVEQGESGGCAARQRGQQPPYEMLASPDYAFGNDRQQRLAHRSELAARGLGV